MHQYFWVLLIILVSLVAIVVLYRLLFPNLQKVKAGDGLEKKVAEGKGLERHSEASEEPVGRGGEGSQAKAESMRELALQFLDADERRVVEALLEAKGSMLQKEISWKTGFSRVKTHRVLTRLIRRGVVSAEKYYNTNKITLTDTLLDKENKQDRPKDKSTK